jgi:hypothetical protein
MENKTKITIPGIWLAVYETLRSLKRLEIKWATGKDKGKNKEGDLCQKQFRL